MSRQPVTLDGRADTTEFRQGLLRRLGLKPDASDQDIESAHNGLVEFLELAPHGLQSWASARTNDVDEAYALLSGPEQDLIALAADRVSLAKDGLDETSHPAPAAPAAPAAGRPRRNLVVGGAMAMAIAAVVVGVYFMGKGSEVPGISGKTTNGASAAPAGEPTSAPLDQAKVTALTKKVTANPKDIASLQGLGDTYFASADYKNASVWERKILAVDPKNQVALLALGAAQFNLGNQAEAKKQWLIAAALYPNSAEVHYDLGFLYMSQTPPDMAKMTAEWNKVIAIDPNSSIAKTVATHLKGAKSTPAAHPTPTPSAK